MTVISGGKAFHVLKVELCGRPTMQQQNILNGAGLVVTVPVQYDIL